jgi:hypothetical protein
VARGTPSPALRFQASCAALSLASTVRVPVRVHALPLCGQCVAQRGDHARHAALARSPIQPLPPHNSSANKPVPLAVFPACRPQHRAPAAAATSPSRQRCDWHIVPSLLLHSLCQRLHSAAATPSYGSQRSTRRSSAQRCHCLLGGVVQIVSCDDALSGMMRRTRKPSALPWKTACPTGSGGELSPRAHPRALRTLSLRARMVYQVVT